jgi:ribosomal protection tetracycline resistance protein
MHRFRVEAPADTLGALLPVLAALRAVPRTTETQGHALCAGGWIPAAQVHGLERQLPGLTVGRASWRAPSTTTRRSRTGTVRSGRAPITTR